MTSAATADLDETHDPSRLSWLESANDAGQDFPIQNLPLGVFSAGSSERRIGVAIGDHILDLAALPVDVLPPAIERAHLMAPALDGLLTLGRPILRDLRRRVSKLLSASHAGDALRARRGDVLIPMSRCALHRPTSVPDFTDFYAGIEHARRAGSIARPGSALAPNYGSQPIGYHGRASTVRVSGHPVRRPKGPRPAGDATAPTLGPTAALDFELELGIVLCGSADQPVAIGAASERIGGFCLLNDWSARDIQRWEMAPLGPFLGKSFATTVSPWLVSPDALAPFRVPAMPRAADHPALLAYLEDADDQAFGGLDIELTVHLITSAARKIQPVGEIITTSNTRHLYWTPAQMIAHHAVNGCELRPGDLFGTGTISGPEVSQSGSLLELTANGREPITLTSGEQRAYLEDGDEVHYSGRCHRSGLTSIGFGPCTGVISSGEATP